LVLVKEHMTRDNDSVCGEVKVTIAFVVIGKAKKDTLRRAWCEFIGHGGGEVRITTTSENSKMIIMRGCTEKSLVEGGRF
jgi:hypothetical protein